MSIRSCVEDLCRAVDLDPNDVTEIRIEPGYLEADVVERDEETGQPKISTDDELIMTTKHWEWK